MSMKFKVGSTYWTRSICDHECIYRMTVLKRTAQTITVTLEHRNDVSPELCAKANEASAANVGPAQVCDTDEAITSWVNTHRCAPATDQTVDDILARHSIRMECQQ